MLLILGVFVIGCHVDNLASNARGARPMPDILVSANVLLFSGEMKKPFGMLWDRWLSYVYNATVH